MTATEIRSSAKPERHEIAVTAGPAFEPSLVFRITGLIAVAGASGHLLLGLNYRFHWGLPWQPIAGIAIVLVAVIAFGGFYVVSRRTRVAIASSFLLTFLVILTYAMTVPAVADVTNTEEGLVTDFRIVVQTIIGFYFGAEILVSVSKVVGTSRQGGTPAEIRSSDRDLV